MPSDRAVGPSVSEAACGSSPTTAAPGGQRDRRPRRHVGAEARHGGDPPDGLLDRLGRSAQRTEVGGLHRTRSAAGRDEVPGLGQCMTETGRRGIGGRMPLQRMAAHDPHDRSARDELVELVGDGVVVDRAHERAVGIGAQLRVDEPRVGARVGRRGIPLLEPGVEVGGEVEAPPRVDGRVGDAGEDDGTAVQEDLGHPGWHGAAEHDEAREVTVGGEPVGVAGEVEVLQPQTGTATRRRRGGRPARRGSRSPCAHPASSPCSRRRAGDHSLRAT